MLNAGPVVVATFLSSGLWAASDNSSASDRGVLITVLGSIAVSIIGGLVAVVISRKPAAPESPSARYVDAPTSNALPNALSELYEEAMERAVKAEIDLSKTVADLAMWKDRAIQAGWVEQR